MKWPYKNIAPYILVFLVAVSWFVVFKIRPVQKFVETGICERRHQNTTLVIDGIKYVKKIKKHAGAVECFSSGSDTFCLPAWIILAGGKSGSSALWNYLCNNVRAKCKVKELHPSLAGGPFVAFAKKTMGDEQTEGFSSGNFGFSELSEDIQDFIIRHTCIKFIVILRSPLDWAYAAWNFWCDPRYDGASCKSGAWVSRLEGAIPRTPQNFEKILKKYCVDDESPKARKKGCRIDPWTVWREATRWIDKGISPDRIRVVRSEDMQASPESVLSQIFPFINLKFRLRDAGILKKAFNTGLHNGISTSGRLESVGSYEPMNPESVDILCKIADYHATLSRFANTYQFPILDVDLQKPCPVG